MPLILKKYLNNIDVSFLLQNKEIID